MSFDPSTFQYDIEEFYSADAKVGSVMLNMANENFLKDPEAKKFLGKAASKPHRLPELKDLAIGLFWKTQQNFFYSLIRNYPKKDYEDLMSAMAIGFLTWLPKFDADNYSPGTFFKTRVLHFAYEEVIKINEIVPEHKIHIKKMLLMQKEALIEDGKAVTLEALAEALPDVPINDIKDMLPYIGDDGASMSLDTLGDGGVISNQVEKKILTPEETAIEKDKQECFVKALYEVFDLREINILLVYNENGKKIADAKRRLAENYGYYDITEDEIRRTWGDAANRISVYTMAHPETAEYLGHFASLYAVRNKNCSNVGTEEESDSIHSLWDDTINCDDDLSNCDENGQITMFGMMATGT